MIRAGRAVEHAVEHRPDLPLGDHEAGHLGVGGVDQEQVDALVAEPGEPGQVGEPAVQRQLVELDVAGVQHEPGRRADGDGQRVRDGVVDREVLAVPRPCRSRAPSGTSSRCGVRRCSLHLAATSASVNREPTMVRSGRCRSRNGTAPMWSSWPWVSTSASMSSSRSSMARKSGRIRSTPGRVLGREQHAAVDDEQPARRTRRRSCCGRPRRSRRARPPAARPPGSGGGGPIGSSAGLTSSGGPARAGPGRGAAAGCGGRSGSGRTGRWAAQLALRSRAVVGGCGGPARRSAVRRASALEVGRGAIAAPRRAAGRRAVAAVGVGTERRRRRRAGRRRWRGPAASVAGGSGSRVSPTSSPRSRSAVLANTAPPTRPIARITGSIAGVDRRGRGPARRPRTRRACTRSRSATTCPMTLTNPTAPTDEPRQVHRVVAGVVGERRGGEHLGADRAGRCGRP